VPVIDRIGNAIFVAFCMLVLLPIGMLHNVVRYLFTGKWR
jgi:hypothetical protein